MTRRAQQKRGRMKIHRITGGGGNRMKGARSSGYMLLMVLMMVLYSAANGTAN